ncbi:MAG: fibrobacter succinogenes major paralogous domain-containing protein [Saprospiraceae bacterium]|nr:fibrobacter succinogenes major paralogous domain-containing protein [Saprospiraceae bacterium]
MKYHLLLLPFALLLTTCKKDTVQAPDSTYPQQGVFTINKNVRELDLATASLLIEVDSAFLLFQGINSALSALQTGEVVLCPPTDEAPNGCLRKVVKVESSGDQFKVYTEQGSLDDLIDECNIFSEFKLDIAGSATLSSSFKWVLADLDNNEQTTYDQMTLSGAYALTPTVIFELKKEKGKSILDGEMRFGLKNANNTNISLKSFITGAGFNKEKVFIEIPCGITPIHKITIQPVVKLIGGVSGSLTGDMTFGRSASEINEYYWSYKNRTWSTTSSHNENIQPLAIDIESSAKLRGYIKPSLELIFFESAAISMYGEGFIDAEATLKAQDNTLDVCIQTGVNAGATLKTETFLSKFVGDWSFNLFNIGIYQSLIQPCSTYMLQNTIKDIDGNTYNIVDIGGQQWFKENLQVTHYRNGDPIPQITDSVTWANASTGAWCYYKFNPSYGPAYGKLYNWHAVNDPRGLAPLGSHVPSDAEWTVLTTFLGGESIAGQLLKGTDYWGCPGGNTGTNTSGFTALPAGVIDGYFGAKFLNVDVEADFWTSTNDSGNNAWSRRINCFNSVARWSSFYPKDSGLSVRCVKE